MAKPHNVAETTDLLIAAGVAAHVQAQDGRFAQLGNCLFWAETRHQPMHRVVVVGEFPWQGGRSSAEYVLQPFAFGAGAPLDEQQTALVKQLAKANVG